MPHMNTSLVLGGSQLPRLVARQFCVQHLDLRDVYWNILACDEDVTTAWSVNIFRNSGKACRRKVTYIRVRYISVISVLLSVIETKLPKVQASLESSVFAKVRCLGLGLQVYLGRYAGRRPASPDTIEPSQVKRTHVQPAYPATEQAQGTATTHSPLTATVSSYWLLLEPPRHLRKCHRFLCLLVSYRIQVPLFSRLLSSSLVVPPSTTVQTCLLHSSLSSPASTCTSSLPIMAVLRLRLRDLLSLGTLASLSFVSAQRNYSSYSEIDMARAQLALLDSRPDKCPPW